MNNDNFLIEESDLELAREICKDIDDIQLRNRSVANVLAANLAIKYFQEIDVDVESGLHKISNVLEDIDIADIYLKGSYVDVRVYFNDNELCIPKSHFERGLKPVAYMFIKLDSELSGGLVTGFVLPSSIDEKISQGDYYFVKEEDLISYYDVEPLFITKDSPDIPENFETIVFDYLDGKLSLEDKNAFYKILLDSEEYRVFLRGASNAKNILSFVSLVEPVSDEPVESMDQEQILDSGEDDISLEFSGGMLEDFEESNLEPLLEEQAKIYETDLLEPVDDATFELNCNEDVLAQEDESLIGTIDSSSGVEDFVTEDVQSLQEDQGFETGEGYLSDEFSTLEELVENSDVIDVTESFELSETDFSTNTTPSLDTIEKELESELEQIVLEDNLEEEVVTEEESIDSEGVLVDFVEDPIENFVQELPESDDVEEVLENDNTAELSEVSEELIEDSTTTNQEQIDELFCEELTHESLEEDFDLPQKRTSSKILPIIGLLVILGSVGYWGYDKFVNSKYESNEFVEPPQVSLSNNKTSQENAQKEEAMPVETIENIKPIETMNEGNAVSLPPVVQEFSSPVVVSNLSVLWEVPAGYVTNATAKRYFTKIGKIVQLNLKSELLLLDKVPVVNKFGVELEYNKNSNKFIIKDIAISSGEKSIDDLVEKVVKNALDLNLKTNMNIFSTIVGNPTLIIRL